ncbi:MAG: hypothetical protein EA401_00585, partial [Planctomycetota bacterium]
SSLIGASCFITELDADWANSLNALGEVFHQFRKDLGADIKDFRASSREPDKRYRKDPGPDHNRVANWINDDSMCDNKRGETGNHLPDRAGFGLPYPMQFGGRKPTFIPDMDKTDRRASPVIFKLHRLPNAQHVGLITILGGRFLPQGVQVKAEEGRRSLSLPIPARPKVLADFAAELRSKGYTEVRA